MIKPVRIFREFLYPSGIKCIVCDAELSKDTRYGVCPNCKLPYNENYCTVCGRAVPVQNIVCDTCKNVVSPFESARSSFIYGDSRSQAQIQKCEIPCVGYVRIYGGHILFNRVEY